MSQQISSDHPTVTTIRATLSRSGATDRPRIDIDSEDEAHFSPEEIVRLVLDGHEYRTRAERAFGTDDLQIRGAYDSPRQVRNPGEGTNRLDEWFAHSSLTFGRTVLIDVVTERFKYGLREPGERAVYEATEAPDDSLASIAKDLEDSQ